MGGPAVKISQNTAKKKKNRGVFSNRIPPGLRERRIDQREEKKGKRKVRGETGRGWGEIQNRVCCLCDREGKRFKDFAEGKLLGVQSREKKTPPDQEGKGGEMGTAGQKISVSFKMENKGKGQPVNPGPI